MVEDSKKTVARYYFHEVLNCNMCGAPSSEFKILGRRLNCTQGYSPHKKIGVATTVMQCKKCELNFTNPQPIPFDLQDHYDMDPFTYWPAEYFKLKDDEFGAQIEHLKKIKGIKKGDKYLDIGAGLGKSMLALEKEGMDVYGIEASDSFYKMAIEKMGINPKKLQKQAIEHAEFEENFFDFISFGAVLEHLYYPDQSIIKALSWLKKGGIIHIEVPNTNYLIVKLLNVFNRLRGTDYVCNLSPMHEPYHLFEFGKKTFETHAQQNNYELLDWNIDVCTTPVPKPFRMVLDPIMDVMNTGMQLTVWLKK